MRKFLALFMLLSSLLSAKSNLSPQECLKIKYAHTLGGTMHSKHQQTKRLLRKITKRLPLTSEEALKSIQTKYPSLQVQRLKLVIQNCQVSYRTTSKKELTHFFDAYSLEKITKVIQK